MWDIQRCLAKNKSKKKCLELFVVLLGNIVNAANHTKCVSLSNQKCMTQTALINLHPNKYNQKFHYYPAAVKLDICVGSWIVYLIKNEFQIKQKI